MSIAYMKPDNIPEAIPFICCSDNENPWNIIRSPAVERTIAMMTSLSIDSLSKRGARRATNIGAV
jgi:hypothetical protein